MSWPSSPVRALALAALLLVDAALAAFLLLPRPMVELTLDLAEATHLGGFGYMVGLPPLARFPLELPHDALPPHRRSPLQLFEDGRALAPAHVLHQQIVELGGGRYSHWAGPSEALVFSSSDGSDPRTNGRKYLVRGRPVADHRLANGILLLLALQLSLAVGWIRERASPRQVGTEVSAGIALVLVAAVFQVSALRRDRPRVLSMGDAGMITGLIAAAQHPDRLAADHALGAGSSVAFYATVLRPVVEQLDRVVDDMATAYLLTYGPLVFLQALGFYLLGRILLESRLHAFLLALLTLAPVYTSGGDLWGIADEPLTRMLYGAAAPYLLAASLVILERRYGWLALPVLLALSVYLHPVSQPSFAASCLLAAVAVASGSPARRIAHGLGAGLVLAAAMVPYALTYFSAGVAGMGAVLGSAVADHRQFLADYFGSQYFDVRVALRMLLEGGTGSGQGPWGWRWLVWIGGLASLVLLSASRDPARGRPARFLLWFLFGILVTSAGFAALDQRLAASRGSLPLLIDLVRNIRFAIPVLLLGLVMGLDALAARPLGRRAATAALVALTAIWWHWQPPRPVKLLHARLGLDNPDASVPDRDLSRILAVARSLPAGSLFLPIGDEQGGMALRYAALQPLAFLVKDLNFMLYSGHGDVRRWLEHRERLRILESARDPQTAAAVLGELLGSTGARYLLVKSRSLAPAAQLALTDAGEVVAARGEWQIVAPRVRSATYSSAH